MKSFLLKGPEARLKTTVFENFKILVTTAVATEPYKKEI